MNCFHEADCVTREDILRWVRGYVWSGEYDDEEVELLIEDHLGKHDEVDEEWLRDVISRERAVKREAEKMWPEVTDYDRLESAFAALQEQGVIALHLAGFTQSDGLEEVEETYHDNEKEKSNYIGLGHCFYTEQDQKWALKGEGLYIGFGHLSGDNDKAVEVGQRLRSALEAQGLIVDWDGTVQARVFLKGFRWQRRGPC